MTTTQAPTALSLLLTTAATISQRDGISPAAAVGHIMGRMATERPSLLGKVLAEMAARPEFADSLADLLDMGEMVAAR